MGAAAMSRMVSEGAGVELNVVGGVVAVDVRFFENVGLGVEYPEMADGVLNDVGMAVAESMGEAVPGSGGVERSDAVGDSHGWGIWGRVCGEFGTTQRQENFWLSCAALMVSSWMRSSSASAFSLIVRVTPTTLAGIVV